jgi:release factor glutamine methyltransferase
LSTATTQDHLEQLVLLRVQGVPLEQILGWAEFAGLRIAVAPGVFVPRRRTELLLQQALALAPAEPVVLELCCGSAALSVALAAHLKQAELYASDIDPAAVRCAGHNLASLRGVVGVFEGDLYDALPPSVAGRVDLVLANAPYVPTGAIRLMPPEARLYEPPVALDGGSDGLDIQRRIVAGARQWLAPTGWLLLETSQSQASGLVATFQHHGLAAQIVISDELDATAVIGRGQGVASRDIPTEGGH